MSLIDNRLYRKILRFYGDPTGIGDLHRASRNIAHIGCAVFRILCPCGITDIRIAFVKCTDVVGCGFDLFAVQC